jgi:hypothetical protein
VCEVDDERHVEGWFKHHFGRGDPTYSYVPVRVDNLTELKDDRSLDAIPETELVAMAREVKNNHLARLKEVESAQQSSGSQQPVESDSCWPSNGTRGQLTRYRIWIRSSDLRTFTREAENAEQVAEWFQASKLECETDLTTYHLESITEMEDDEDRMAKECEAMLAQAKESKPLGMEDQSVKPRLTEQEFYATIQRLKEEAKRQT